MNQDKKSRGWRWLWSWIGIFVLLLGWAFCTWELVSAAFPPADASPDDASLADGSLVATLEETRHMENLPPPKRVVIPKLNEVIKIDGELNESAWAKAAVLKPFYGSQDSRLEREKTEVRVWYDDQALYLGWTCQDTDIQASETRRDGALWEQDAVEFFIAAQGMQQDFEFEWNPLNAVFDANVINDLDDKLVSIDFKSDKSYTAKGMKNAVKVKAKVWTVEVRLPFEDLGHAPPKPGEVWRGNFFRCNINRYWQMEQTCWSPVYLTGFHQPSRFGFLEFGE